MTRAMRLGITGKIASGKSTLSELLRAAGIDVIDTDTLAKEMMESDREVREAVAGVLGAGAYDDHGLDRRYVADQIFGDDAKRLALEAIVHPAVSQELERRFERGVPGSIVGAESALILQSHLVSMFDYIVLVDAPDAVVIERVKASGKLTEDDARQRLADQGYDKVRRDEVDITLQNSGSREEFVQRASSVIPLLKALAQRDLPAVPIHAIEDDEPEEDDEMTSETVDDSRH